MPAVEQQRDFLLAADKRRQECGADRGETALCRPLTELLVGFAPQRHRRPDRRPRYAAARALTPDRTTDNPGRLPRAAPTRRRVGVNYRPARTAFESDTG